MGKKKEAAFLKGLEDGKKGVSWDTSVLKKKAYRRGRDIGYKQYEQDSLQNQIRTPPPEVPPELTATDHLYRYLSLEAKRLGISDDQMNAILEAAVPELHSALTSIFNRHSKAVVPGFDSEAFLQGCAEIAPVECEGPNRATSVDDACKKQSSWYRECKVYRSHDEILSDIKSTWEPRVARLGDGFFEDV